MKEKKLDSVHLHWISHLLTCWPHAFFRAWNFSTLPALNAKSVSISHCLSVFLSDSRTGCISFKYQTHVVRANKSIKTSSFQWRRHITVVQCSLFKLKLKLKLLKKCINWKSWNKINYTFYIN